MARIVPSTTADVRGVSSSNPEEALFEFRPCPLCGCSENTPRYPIDRDYAAHLSKYDLSSQEISVAICGRCGHQFIYPLPTAKFITAYYASYMVEAQSHFYRDRADHTIPERFRRIYEERLHVIRKHLGRTGALLDVGCGLGMFLRLAREQGFSTTGVEANKEAVEHLLREHGIKAANCLFEEFKTEDKYDVITMWDLLEHLVDPIAALRKAYSLLRPGGVIVVETPARDSVAHWLAKLFYHLSFCRVTAPLNLIYGMHHLQYFSREGLSMAMRKVGFDIISLLGASTDLESLRNTNGSSFANQLKSMTFRLVFAWGSITGKSNKQILIAARPNAHSDEVKDQSGSAMP